ncbi:MAG: hypothetical protein Q8Q05_01035 [bacterium]|nr:hypothetical protein [bacterium]
MERIPATKVQLAAITSQLPRHVMFLYGQQGVCSACGSALTFSELSRNVQKFLTQPQESDKPTFLLCWCEACRTNPIAQQLAMSELTEAARQGPVVDDVWLTISPDGTRFVVSEGLTVGEDKETLHLREYLPSDYPGGIGAFNILPWQEKYSEWLKSR